MKKSKLRLVVIFSWDKGREFGDGYYRFEEVMTEENFIKKNPEVKLRKNYKSTINYELEAMLIEIEK
jgi:hypothetical protein